MSIMEIVLFLLDIESFIRLRQKQENHVQESKRGFGESRHPKQRWMTRVREARRSDPGSAVNHANESPDRPGSQMCPRITPGWGGGGVVAPQQPATRGQSSNVIDMSKLFSSSSITKGMALLQRSHWSVAINDADFLNVKRRFALMPACARRRAANARRRTTL